MLVTVDLTMHVLYTCTSIYFVNIVCIQAEDSKLFSFNLALKVNDFLL